MYNIYRKTYNYKYKYLFIIFLLNFIYIFTNKQLFSLFCICKFINYFFIYKERLGIHFMFF